MDVSVEIVFSVLFKIRRFEHTVFYKCCTNAFMYFSCLNFEKYTYTL